MDAFCNGVADCQPNWKPDIVADVVMDSSAPSVSTAAVTADDIADGVCSSEIQQRTDDIAESFANVVAITNSVPNASQAEDVPS